MIRMRTPLLLIGLFAAVSTRAFATTTGLPWETPLTTLKNSLTGPVALVLTLSAFVVCGGLLIFNDANLGDFAKKMIMVIMIIAGFFAGASILTVLFGFTAAVL